MSENKKMLMAYIRLAALAAVACLLAGFILPWLISAESLGALLLGATIVILGVPTSIIILKYIIREDLSTWKQFFTSEENKPAVQSKKILKLVVLLCILFVAMGINAGCSKVEAGYVGVKVYLLGGDKGVDSEVLGVGRYWIGWNEELFLFPTFQQTAVWSRERGTDESLTFQTKEGLSVNADVSVSYTIDPEKVSLLFQRYRKGVEEITTIYLRNVVRDALVQAASTRGVESIYGEGKSDLIDTVKQMVADKMNPVGIVIDYVSFVGDLRLPKNVIASINAKIEATQKAQQRENELREAEAQAKKDVARAEGEAKARIAQSEGEARSTLVKAEAQAKANRLLSESLTPELVQYFGVQAWNGQLPQVSGGGTPIVALPGVTGRQDGK